MSHLLGASPLLVVIIGLLSRRLTPLAAGLLGTAWVIVLAPAIAPRAFGLAEIASAVAKALWLSWLVGIVIFGGLFFRSAVAVSSGSVQPSDSSAPSASARRRRAFSACFLVGPFTEAATGFGVGQVASIAILLGMGLRPIHAAVLALFSQILVPWGAMANGTMVGAAFSGLGPTELGVRSAIVNAPLTVAWLILFWRMAPWAGLPATGRAIVVELCWVAVMSAAVLVANVCIGPEVAALAALGPIIVLQFMLDERPDRDRLRSTFRIVWPYAMLIATLAATRAIPFLRELLRSAGAIAPFGDSLAWTPLVHPATWLVGLALFSAIIQGKGRDLVGMAAGVWWQSWRSIATICIFLLMAQLMSDAGIASLLAEGLAGSVGRNGILATPVLAGVFGWVTGSGNATNALLMTSQVQLATTYELSVPWIAAMQNVAAASLTMLSPARVAMACALVGQRGMEGAVYAKAWPLGLVPIILLIAFCCLLLAGWLA